LLFKPSNGPLSPLLAAAFLRFGHTVHIVFSRLK